MSDEARRGYGMLATLFLLVGGGFAALALLQMAGLIHFFQGNPLGVALIVLVVGALLWWTVRTAPEQKVEGGAGEALDDGSDEGVGAPGEAPSEPTAVEDERHRNGNEP